VASRIVYLVVLAVWIGALWLGLDFARQQKQPKVAVPTTSVDWPVFFTANILPSLPVADEFDTPLRPPDGEGVVISMPYMEKFHWGEDWTTAKGDAALGEPVYSVADGWVSVAQDYEGAWGKVIFIDYRLPDGRYPPFVEVMYAQLNTMEVAAGQFVKRGQRIGTVGNANGTYKAHLHWEARYWVGMGLGAGFEDKRDGLLGPSEFLAAHRGERSKQPLLMRQLTAQELEANEANSPTRQNDWGTDY
jgi:murein DD-endopeptidase MepM/ murein hydrolase activator NlpD